MASPAIDVETWLPLWFVVQEGSSSLASRSTPDTRHPAAPGTRRLTPGFQRPQQRPCTTRPRTRRLLPAARPRNPMIATTAMYTRCLRPDSWLQVPAPGRVGACMAVVAVDEFRGAGCWLRAAGAGPGLCMALAAIVTLCGCLCALVCVVGRLFFVVVSGRSVVGLSGRESVLAHVVVGRRSGADRQGRPPALPPWTVSS